MMLVETFRTANRSLRANKLRSMLTILGIVIGVASMVAMIAIGAGARVQIEDQIRTLGANVLMILPETEWGSDVREENGAGPILTEADAEVLATQAPGVRAAAPSVRRTFQIIAGNRNLRSVVNGTTPAYFVIREWGLASGRYFTDVETAAGDKVALLGATVAEQLFGSPQAAIGESIRILNAQFIVVGVLSEKGASGVGRDQDNVIFIPITAAKQRLIGGANQVDRQAVDYILAKAVSDDAMSVAHHQATALLRLSHGLRSGVADDFRVSDPAASMQLRTNSARTLTWLLGSVAGVSLLVGGISIMNIMLVSVTERRREIGIRMALGARRAHIRGQFLLEAVLLCLVGGAIGAGLGIAAAVMISQFAGWPVFVSVGSVALAFGFAATVGVLFGYFPASKAAAEDPITCLRSE